MDREPYKEPWELLGVDDSTKITASWGLPEAWTLSRKFPAQFYTEMNSIFDRAISITGDDLSGLQSLQFDVEMLDTKIHHPGGLGKSTEYSHAREFAKLSSHAQFRDLNLDWRKYLAYQAIDQLSFSIYMHVYQPTEELDSVIEIEGDVENIDPVLTEVHIGISSASEFVVLAEVWPVLNKLKDHVDREVQQKLSRSRKEKAANAATMKHFPIAELKEEFYNFYIKREYPSIVEAARRFLAQLPEEKKQLLTPSNAPRTLSEFLGRRLKQEKDS